MRKDSKQIYQGLIEFAENGRVRTVRQTFDELKRFGDVFNLLKDHRDKFQIAAELQFATEVSKIIDILGKEASYLYEATGGKNPDPADPWIIAVATCYGYTVVTNESPRSTVRIPAACRMPMAVVAFVVLTFFMRLALSRKSNQNTSTQGPSSRNRKESRREDDFVSVARRLGCDEDKATFEAKLAKIARAKVEKEKP
jgi:hypothetical protein